MCTDLCYSVVGIVCLGLQGQSRSPVHDDDQECVCACVKALCL